MRKSAFLIAAGFAMLAPTWAQAAGDGYPTPCCQDTIKLFWRGIDAWATPNVPQPYKPVAYKPYAPPPPGTPICCQDTINLFWRGVDAWGMPPAAKK
jgi:hypothetical protein